MNASASSQRSTLIAVAAIIAGGAVAGLLLGRGDAAAPVVTVPEVKAPVTTPPLRVEPAATAPAIAKPAVPELSEAELTALANDSMSGPAPSRLAAIEKLSKAPRDQALPLLKRVLLNGDPAIDRPAALRGLRDLAVAQGDADQRVRDAVREVIYHGDGEELAAAAQDTLDVIAESEAK